MATAKIKGRQGQQSHDRRRKQKRQKRRCRTRRSAGHSKRRKRTPNKKPYSAKSLFPFGAVSIRWLAAMVGGIALAKRRSLEEESR